MNKTPKCILICVGSELLRGKINTHSSTIARRLSTIGLALHAERTVRDEQSDIAQAIRDALANYDGVLATGGLGPTFDDLTREAASEATGRPLRQDPKLLREIRRKFQRAHTRMPPANARQAFLLEGARAIPNSKGTAPGQWLMENRRNGETGKRGNALSDSPSLRFPVSQVLILLPGPPRELHPMLDGFVLPHLRKAFPTPPQTQAHFHFVGVPESKVDHKIRPLIERMKRTTGTTIDFTILAHLGLVDFDIFVRGRTHALQGIVQAVKKMFPNALYGMNDDYPLGKVVGDLLVKRRATLAVAESCTGGMLASRLTDRPGSSRYFLEGIVTYADAAKTHELNVPAPLIRKHGAVSRPVALAMARGVRERARSTWGLAITGIAGPSGGTRRKPVGLVYIAAASARRAACQEFRFSGGRDAVRQRAVLAALDLLRKAL